MHRPLLALTLTAALAATFAATPAQACGGLFCNNAQPVNQTAERILFIERGGDTVTAVVEILYDGPSESFSWLVPVPGVPEVGVSSGHVLDRLQQLTNPQYLFNTVIEGTCADGVRGPFPRNGGRPDFNDANNGSNNGANNGGVSVVASGVAGPYDYQVIQVDPDLPDPTGAAVAWLTENGYDVAGPELLGEYLDAGMNLLGFKLNKTATTGSIRPVTMTYQTQRPMIPIKLTAVAANDDMGVLVWVFGESRAVPVNYRHLVLNEAAINWFDPSSNYNDLVSLAADESGGQGFVTEAALPSDILRGQLFTNLESDQWDSIHFNGNLSDIELIYSVVYQFRFWDGLLDALAATIPLPAQTTLTEFISCIECYGYDENSDIEGFEHREFINAILELVIYPAQNTESLVTERSYMTRFYTTLSAEEMTVDPIFDFNISLSLVDNIHQSTLYVMCGEEDFDFQDAPWRAELPGGQVVSGARRGVWPYDTGEIPANQIIQQLSTTGMGEVVLDNREDIQEMTTDTRDLAAGDDDGGCSTAPTRRAPAPLSPLALLAALALLASRRGRFN